MAKPRDAREIMRLFLAHAFPDASEEGLENASRLMVRWGAEGVGSRMSPLLTVRLMLDLANITGTEIDLDIDRELLAAASDMQPADIPWRRMRDAD